MGGSVFRLTELHSEGESLVVLPVRSGFADYSTFALFQGPNNGLLNQKTKGDLAS
jgi:hypothetical protein